MNCFHATTADHAIGSVITASKPSTQYPDVASRLEAARPNGKPRRDVCLFACETVVAATTFATTQRFPKFKVFEVEIGPSHRAPFRLNAEIAHRMKAGKPYDALIAEYWVPAHPWVFYELFGPSLKIIAEHPQASAVQMAAFQLSYDRDLALSRRL